MINIFNLLRSHHWSKNFLIFVPLLLSDKIINLSSLLEHVYAFIAFSLAASFVYIHNDLVDRENDLNHPIKRNRPIASGKFSSELALKISFLLIASSSLIAFLLGFEIFISLFIYVLLNLGYSLKFKKIFLFDCVILSFFYTMRIIVGSFISNEIPSFSLMLFSIFIFLSLALAKRFQEIKLFSDKYEVKIHGRGYKSSNDRLEV